VSEAIEEQPKRRETGPIQFGDDWPGIFIRGDEALGMAVYLEAFLNGLDFYRTAIERHIKLLKSCDIEALKAQEPCNTCGGTKIVHFTTPASLGDHTKLCPEKIKHMEEAIKKFVESMDAEPTIERSDDE